MLDGKLDSITKVILADRDYTRHRVVTPDTTSMVDCEG